MDAKKCDRCGRFYEEYGEYKVVNTFEYKVKKTSVIQMGTKTGQGDFIHKSQFDLCPLCMDELDKFLTDPNAFQCLGNCDTCEKRNGCEVLKQAKEIEEYERKVFKEPHEEKADEQI